MDDCSLCKRVYYVGLFAFSFLPCFAPGGNLAVSADEKIPTSAKGKRAASSFALIAKTEFVLRPAGANELRRPSGSH